MTVYVIMSSLDYGITTDKNKNDAITEKLNEPLLETLSTSKTSKLENLKKNNHDISFIKCYRNPKYLNFMSNFKNVNFVGVLDNYNKKIEKILSDDNRKKMVDFLKKKNNIPIFIDYSKFHYKIGLFANYIEKLSLGHEWDVLFEKFDRKKSFQDYYNYNKAYYETLKEIILEGDSIVITDPGLWLLPSFFNMKIDISVVFLNSFPKYEFFRCLYSNKKIFKSLLKTKLIFQNKDEERVFRNIADLLFPNFDQSSLSTRIVSLVSDITQVPELFRFEIKIHKEISKIDG